MLSFSAAVLLHTVPSFPNIASVQLHRLVYILISDHITITMLKTTVHVRWNSAGVSANGRQWWVGIVG